METQFLGDVSRRPACILHIGTLKTGSTAIQQAVWHNREVLAEAGYYVPSVFNTQGGRLACWFLSDFESTRGFKVRFKSRMEYQRIRERKFGKLEKMLRRRSSSTFILSAEQFCLFSENEVAQTCDWINNHFRCVKVVLYLRAPHEYVTSHYSTQLYFGRVGPFRLPERAEDFSDAGVRFSKLLSCAETVVRPFDRALLSGGDVVSDFMQVIGAEAVTIQTDRVFENPSIHAEAQECLRLVNFAFRKYDVDSVSDSRAIGFRRFMQQQFLGKGIQPTRAEVGAFIRANAKVYAAYARSAGGFDFSRSADNYPEERSELSVPTMRRTAAAILSFLGSKFGTQSPELYRACVERLAPWVDKENIMGAL